MPTLPIHHHDNNINPVYHIGLGVHAKSTSITYAGSYGSLGSDGVHSSSNLSVQNTLHEPWSRHDPS